MSAGKPVLFEFSKPNYHRSLAAFPVNLFTLNLAETNPASPLDIIPLNIIQSHSAEVANLKSALERDGRVAAIAGSVQWMCLVVFYGISC